MLKDLYYIAVKLFFWHPNSSVSDSRPTQRPVKRIIGFVLDWTGKIDSDVSLTPFLTFTGVKKRHLASRFDYSRLHDEMKQHESVNDLAHVVHKFGTVTSTQLRELGAAVMGLRELGAVIISGLWELRAAVMGLWELGAAVISGLWELRAGII